jgi:hypothetical protein
MFFSKGIFGNTNPIPGNADSFVHGNGILMELERRELKIIKLKPLERTSCRAMVDAYIKKSVQSEVRVRGRGWCKRWG